jgi:hypothetical protein
MIASTRKVVVRFAGFMLMKDKAIEDIILKQIMYLFTALVFFPDMPSMIFISNAISNGKNV